MNKLLMSSQSNTRGMGSHVPEHNLACFIFVVSQGPIIRRERDSERTQRWKRGWQVRELCAGNYVPQTNAAAVCHERKPLAVRRKGDARPARPEVGGQDGSNASCSQVPKGHRLVVFRRLESGCRHPAAIRGSRSAIDVLWMWQGGCGSMRLQIPEPNALFAKGEYCLPIGQQADTKNVRVPMQNEALFALALSPQIPPFPAPEINFQFAISD